MYIPSHCLSFTSYYLLNILYIDAAHHQRIRQHNRLQSEDHAAHLVLCAAQPARGRARQGGGGDHRAHHRALQVSPSDI